MIFLKTILLGISAFGFGLLSSGGVFTVFVSVGLVPRFANKTHTTGYIILYENCIVLGAVLGCVASLFGETVSFLFGEWEAAGRLLLGVFGSFAGMFVGCFAIAIAEMLNTIPISARRIRLGQGVGIIILALALGKTVGSLIYFLLKMGM